MFNIWNKPDLLDELEGDRASVRKKHKFLAYDCYDMRCIGSNYAYCKQGRKLSKTRLIPVVSILRGDIPLACKLCQEEKRSVKLETKL
jgi:hypothetical protein